MVARTNLTDSLLISRQVPATVRTGHIVQQGEVQSQVLVRVGASVITCGYLTNSYTPVDGDLVAIIKQDSSWLVLGTLPSAETPVPTVTIQAGRTTCASGTANSWVNTPIVFPVPFSTIPVVVATPTSAIGATVDLAAIVDAETTLGFTMRVRRGNTTATTVVNWIATTQ